MSNDNDMKKTLQYRGFRPLCEMDIEEERIKENKEKVYVVIADEIQGIYRSKEKAQKRLAEVNKKLDYGGLIEEHEVE